MGKSEKKNSFNLYKLIGECDASATLLCVLSAKTCTLEKSDMIGPCEHYQHLFESYGFLQG